MGRVNRVRQKEVKKQSKLIKKRVVAGALLVITLIFYPIQKLGTSHKPTVPEPIKATMEQKKANKKLAKKIAVKSLNMAKIQDLAGFGAISGQPVDWPPVLQANSLVQFASMTVHSLQRRDNLDPHSVAQCSKPEWLLLHS